MPTEDSVRYALIAESDVANREHLSRVLEDAGWRFDIADSYRSVINASGRRAYDLVITELPHAFAELSPFVAALRKSCANNAVLLVGEAETIPPIAEWDDWLDVASRTVAPSTVAGLVKRISATPMSDESPVEFDPVLALTRARSEYTFDSYSLSRSRFASPLIDALFKCGRIDEHTKLALDLVVQEAIANGLEHGNLELKSEWREEINDDGVDLFHVLRSQRLKMMPYSGRHVFVTIELHDDIIEIQVRDEGNGFTPPEIQSIAQVTTLSSGRGLSLIHKTVDDVQFRDGGRTIVMKKRLTAPRKKS